jgi:hypothetical protein
MKKKLQKVDTSGQVKLSGEQLWKKTKTREEFESLSDEDQQKANQYLAHRIMQVFELKDKHELDDLLYKAEKVFTQQMYQEYRNQTFVKNHYMIEDAVTDIIRETRTIPAAMVIAQKTGLSRYTVSKHLKQLSEHSLSTELTQVQKMMAPKLLGVLFKMALGGDVKAAKIYLDNVIQKPSSPGYVKNQQNNFININGVEITEEKLKALPEESRQQISEIIRQAQPIAI